MRRAVASAESRRGAGLLLAALMVAAALAPGRTHAADAPAPRGGMQPLEDSELASVRGADGINFNLSNFSLTSSATAPLNLTYQSTNGSSLTLGRIDLSRSDDPDGFADPYSLSLKARTGLPDLIALDFPLNTAGAQAWSLTADFANCDKMVAGTCTGQNFNGGTLQLTGLTMKGGGLYVAPSVLADTQGIAFGFGTRLDIGTLAVYSHGRTAGDETDTIDTSDKLVISGIHLFDANSQGAWMLADVTTHPGLINAVTDANGSYLHLQVGWPTSAAAVTTGQLVIDNITFTSPGTGGTPVVTNLGAASIAGMQLNYVDIKLRTTP